MWDIYRKKRLSDQEADTGITLGTYRQRLDELRKSQGGQTRDREILQALGEWADYITEGLGPVHKGEAGA